jgi:hypothetical protein
MFRAFRRLQIVLALVAFYATVGLGLGFAHKPLQIGNPATVDLSLYALPDGTIPVLCLTPSRDGSRPEDERSHHAGHRCDACIVTVALGFATNAATAPVPDHVLLDQTFGHATWMPGRRPAYAASARSPPVRSVLTS